MRRVIVSNMMSLDGFFEGPNCELDWHVLEPDFFEYARQMLDAADTIVFGRKTYEMMAAYWPKEASDPIADRMNGLPKVVFSSTLALTDWTNTRLVATDAAAELGDLKQQPGRDIVVLGSAELASSLLRAGAVDEYRVIVSPVILGSGKPLFRNFQDRMRLQLAKVRQFGSGVVMLSYRCS